MSTAAALDLMSTLLNASWQAAIVTLGVVVCCGLLRRSSPALRHLLLVLALVKFAIPPSWTAPTGVFSQFDGSLFESWIPSDASDESGMVRNDLSAWPGAASPSTANAGTARLAPDDAMQRGTTMIETAGATAMRTTHDPAEIARSASGHEPSSRAAAWLALLAIYSFGVVALLVHCGWGAVFRLRAWRTAIAAPRTLAAELAAAMQAMGVTRRIEVRLDEGESGPYAFGILKRRILLPRSISALPPEQRRAVLAHEIAHHARGDLWVALVAELLRAVHWANPAIWFLVARLRTIREECCDDAVLARGLADPDVYGEALVRTASLRGSASFVLTARMSDHPIGRRLRRVFSAGIERRPGPSVRDVGVAMVVASLAWPGLATSSLDGGPQASAAPRSAAAKHDIRGRVTTAAGMPISGARIYLSSSAGNRSPRRSDALRAVSDGDGNYRFVALESDLWRGSRVRVIAQKDENGCTFAKVRLGDNDFVLPDSDAPLHGRILDTEGAPIAGARVRFRQVYRDPSHDPEQFVTDLATGRVPLTYPQSKLDSAEWPALDAVATSDAEGRVEIRGVTRDALVALEIDAPGRTRALVYAFAREMEPILHPRRPVPTAGSTLFQGSQFEVLLEPSRVVTGIVLDQATGTPLPDVAVGFVAFAPGASYEASLWEVLEHVVTVSDANGRYRLDGLPASQALRLRAEPWDSSQGHLAHTEILAAGAGEAEIRLDFALDRVVPVGLRMVDGATGSPVSGVEVLPDSWPDHPRANEHPDYGDFFRSALVSNDEGMVFVPYLPGPGRIDVDPPPGYRGYSESAEGVLRIRVDGTLSNGEIVVPEIGTAAVPIRTIELVRSGDRVCRFVDDRGLPLSGCRVFNEVEDQSWSEVHATDRATLVGFDPAHPRIIFAEHPERNLSGYLEWSTDESDLVIRLVPNASVRARLVDTEGRPRECITLTILVGFDTSMVPGQVGSTTGFYSPMRIVTGDDGSFEMPRLMPGVRYMLMERMEGVDRVVERRSIFEWFGVDPGETYEVGSVQTGAKI